LTAALLYAQPEKMVSYDREADPQVEALGRAAGRTRFTFKAEDVLWAQIEPTEMLVIDTRATYGQLHEELLLHAARVDRFIAVARTGHYGGRGEDGGLGLDAAVQELLDQGRFRPHLKVEKGAGLTVLRRAPGEREGDADRV
jgi:hypothetical protein